MISRSSKKNKNKKSSGMKHSTSSSSFSSISSYGSASPSVMSTSHHSNNRSSSAFLTTTNKPKSNATFGADATEKTFTTSGSDLSLVDALSHNIGATSTASAPNNNADGEYDEGFYKTTTCSIVKQAMEELSASIDNFNFDLSKEELNGGSSAAMRTSTASASSCSASVSSSSSVVAAIYGDYRTINQNEFLQECMGDASENVTTIVHFFDSEDDTATKTLDSLLEELAIQYTNVKFVRINGKLCPYVAPKMNIKRFPTVLALDGGGNTIDKLCDFEMFGLLVGDHEWDEEYLHDWIDEIVESTSS